MEAFTVPGKTTKRFWKHKPISIPMSEVERIASKNTLEDMVAELEHAVFVQLRFSSFLSRKACIADFAVSMAQLAKKIHESPSLSAARTALYRGLA